MTDNVQVGLGVSEAGFSDPSQAKANGFFQKNVAPLSSGSIFGQYRYAFYLLFAVLFAEWLVGAWLALNILDLDMWQYIRLSDMSRAMPAWVLVPSVWLGLVTYKIVKRRVERPTITLLRHVRSNKKWLFRGLILFACFIPMSRAQTMIKSSIPELVDFYFDPYLIVVDRMMFFGVDPWRITHGLFGDWFTIAIDRVYLLWFTYLVLIASWFCFSRNPRFQIRGAFALNLMWIFVGGLGATLMSSVGPCFYEYFFESKYFEPLMENISKDYNGKKLVAFYAMEYLVENQGTGKVGIGISAMPSMHVAMSHLGFLAALSVNGKRWLKIATGIFTFLVFIGSFHLGWHYASDGIVSIIATTLIWILSGKVVDRFRDHQSV